MNTRQANALLQPYLSLLPSETRKELTIVTPDTLGTSYLLHISKDTELKRFIPGISRRGMRREDRTVPRVNTAPSLIGCLLGYTSDMFDFHERKPGAKYTEARAVPFKGGYAIYGFRFDVALQPSRKLVLDVAQSDEHWLVPYDAQHAVYTPELLGKVFYSSVNYEVIKDRTCSRIEMYIEVLTDQPIWFEGRRQLTKGCWRAVVNDLHATTAWNQLSDATVEQINPTDYISVKRNVASMLSLESHAPASARW